MTPREFTAWMARVFPGNRTAAARALRRSRSTLWRWEMGVVPIPLVVERRLAEIEAERAGEAPKQ